MWERPYIQTVLHELQASGYENEEVKGILLKYYRGLRRTWGFYLNAGDFAKEVHHLHEAVMRKYDPLDPDQIYIGHLKHKLKHMNGRNMQSLRGGWLDQRYRRCTVQFLN